MDSTHTPTLLEPDELEAELGRPELLLVDLCANYAIAHLPGALHLDYAALLHGGTPSPGLLPDAERLSQVFSGLGLSAEHHVVAYDDEGGGKACRLLWTLDVLGHRRSSLLNGGLHAWVYEGHAVSREPAAPAPSRYRAIPGDTPIADAAYIMAHLDDPGLALLDARTPEEFSGASARAARAGHIPGARHLNWLDTIDPARNMRLKPADELHSLLGRRGLTPDREIVTYCHTHHRSSHSYIMLKSLGYGRIRGYPGSWSEWGNRSDTPVEQGY